MRLALIIFAILTGTACGANAQHLKSNKGHESNPYYSNTDTKHLVVSDAEWKKILSPALYATAR